MICKKGEIWWADLDQPRGSEPGYRRPVVVVQSDDFNKSKIRTIIVAVITSNLKLGRAPGNVFLKAAKSTGLNRDSIVNVSQVITLDKSYLVERVGKLTSVQRDELGEGLKLVLDL